jgi:hypothetical protein
MAHKNGGPNKKVRKKEKQKKSLAVFLEKKEKAAGFVFVAWICH